MVEQYFKGCMTCSFLLPSRGRPRGLLRSIVSILSTANRPEQIEILVKLDDDDYSSMDFWTVGIRNYVSKRGNVSFTVGPRITGKWPLRAICIELASKAAGDWICLWNDDAFMIGHRWDEQLAKLPLSGVIVQPGFCKLNESEYTRCQRSAFPFFPNRSWEKFGLDFWPNPCDYQADEVLRVKNGWKTKYLDGITVFHDWHPGAIEA